MSRVSGVLVFRHDRIGDMIVTTPVFRELKRVAPSVRVGVFASPANAAILTGNRSVDRVYVMHRRILPLIREIRAARRDGYDLTINMVFNRTSVAGILANLISPRGVKIGQGQRKTAFYFNVTLDVVQTGRPMVDTLLWMLSQITGFPASGSSRDYAVTPGGEATRETDAFLAKRLLRRRGMKGQGRPYVLFNLSSVEGYRRITPEQAAVIIGWFARNRPERLVLSNAPGDDAWARAIWEPWRETGTVLVRASWQPDLLRLASLVEGAAGVITPDTSLVHFASAAKTPLLALFSRRHTNTWHPVGTRYSLVLADPGSEVSSIPGSRLLEALEAWTASL